MSAEAECRAELDRLRESEERLRLLTEAITDYAIITLDAAGRIASWNEGAQRIKGWTAEEILGQPYERLFTPAQVEAGEPARVLRTALAEGRFAEQAVRRRKDGSLFWADVTMTPLRGAGGQLIGFAKVTRDITERRRHEALRDVVTDAGRALAESLDPATTMETIAGLGARHLADYCAVDLTDAGGTLHRVVARSRDPARQAAVRQGIPDPPRLRRDPEVAELLDRREYSAVQRIPPPMLDRLARNAAHRTALEELGISSFAVFPLWAHGREMGMLVLAWTEEERATPDVVEAGLAVAQRAALAIDNALLYALSEETARTREEVMAIIGHDLRNPLNAIRLSAFALLDRGDLDERQTKGVVRIRSAADRALRLIHALLDFGRFKSGQIALEKRPIAFHELVRDVAEEVAAANPERDIAIAREGDGAILGDVERLSQLITNLVANALQHSPPDSTVRVLTAGSDADEVKLVVHNAGEPIPAELIPVLFEPFRRGPDSGAGRGSLGLGLYIAEQVVAAHGGRIEVESSAASGTTFTASLPRDARGPACAPGRADVE